MQLPDAINNFLRQADAHNYEHVLLVGGDTYDYHDIEGKAAISFIPGNYVPTARYVRYTPTDALLVDLNADGSPDKAVGRWPVRTLDELQTIVDKTLLWKSTQASSTPSALLIAEGDVDRQYSLMLDQLANRKLEGWSVSKAYMDDLGSQGATRLEMLNGLREGHSLTIFNGHGSLTDWGSRLLTWDMAQSIGNAATPSVMMPLACYTTYVNSVGTDTLGHQLLLGGPDGAVAIHGAATLSSLSDNARMAYTVLEEHKTSQTLGQAILRAKKSWGMTGDTLHGWNLIGDPTLQLPVPE
jgi:hypothetical protein